MRISTNSMFNTGSIRMSDLQNSLNKVQLQMTAGKRVLTPSDDPIAASQALVLKESQSINEQYATNRKSAKSSLGMTEGTLQSVTSLLQDVKTLTVNAGNGTLDNEQRKYLASELSTRYDELLALANSRDGEGNYLFSGYQTTSQPFAQTPTGASYAGDQGGRILQVGPQRQMAINDNGSAVFENIVTQGASYFTSTSSGNTGSGAISLGTVDQTVALKGHRYSVTFTDVDEFDIIDTSVTPNETVSSANQYTSGQKFEFNGIQLSISGAPVAGDAFMINPTDKQSVFTTLTDLINLLKTPATDDAGKERLSAGLSIANSNIDSALDNILTVRSSVGSRLKELDSLDAQGDDRNLAFAQSLSELEDLDYTKAITDFSKQKIMLEAAQQAYVKTTGLTLFNYIS